MLRRLECVLAATKDAVLAKVSEIESMPIEVQGPLLLREASSDGTARHFYNTSAMDLSKLGETGTADNLEAYLNALGAAIPHRQMAGMLNPHCECFGELQISTQRQLSRNGSATRIFRPGSTIKDQKPEDSPTFRVRY